LQEKVTRLKVATRLMPCELAYRLKQPFRAPIRQCFFGSAPQECVSDLLAEQTIRQSGYFDVAKVARLVDKCQNKPEFLLENMALVGILCTQLVDDVFVRHFPVASPRAERCESDTDSNSTDCLLNAFAS
jgi:asparagine synthase (glutamine-hydrolysing)